jgi:NitT/TauT family transport system permease protein
MVLASPAQTLNKLLELLLTGSFWQQLLITLARLCYALTLACLIGFILGFIAGRHAWLKFYLAPFRWILMSIPPVIVVLLAMLWFGMGSKMVVFITVLLLTPTIYINTQKSVEQIDRQWFELAQVYQFSWYQRLSKIYIPAISAPLCATLIIVCCNGVRIVVLAEVLGSHQGVGYELANASSHFDTAELYAWVSVSLLIVAILELVILRPIQNYLLHWRELS